MAAMLTLLSFLPLLLLADVIIGSNDTLNNEIPITGDIFYVEEEVPEDGESITSRSLEEIFKDAEQSYLDEDWDGCIEGFNQAQHRYKLYRRMVTNCRQKCRAEAAGTAPIFPENIEDLHFYEKKVRETLCLLVCNQNYRELAGAKALRRLSHEAEQKFFDHRVYEYLHICYYQRHRYQDAANTIFTFLVRHPNHEPSIETLKFYLTLPDVKEEDTVNLESPPFVTIYFKGIAAYEEGNYKGAVDFFESSLQSYIESEEECRTYCEAPFDQGWHPEFTSSIANHFAYCLKCKRACSRLLQNVNGDYRTDLLRSHYDYLQFSYYKLGKLKAACAAVESYLLFMPTDETMLHNKKYYSALPNVSEEYFTPRKEALSYIKRQEYELSLMRYISEEFAVIDAKFEEYTKLKKPGKKRGKELGKELRTKPILHPPPGHSPASQTQLTGNLSMIRDEEKEIRKGQETERAKVRADASYLIAMEGELGGKNRYMADGFLNSSECQSLIQLASIAAVEGDGYDENKSPHSVYERFEGITVGRAALMVYFGQIEPERLELLLEGTEAVREHVERYFNLDRQLYFTYTHLVCRTALPDSPMSRDDLSHEIHADNCLLKDENHCSRESPAYVWRDYSAILYLNDNFAGGEFFFAEARDSREAKATVLPRCGRMVAFSAGEENLHGVRGVLTGKRCALALWFTQDQRYLEYERILAEVILKRVRSAGPVQQNDFHIPPRYEDVLIHHFKKDDLLGQLLRDSS